METLKDLFRRNNDYYLSVNLTDNYGLYIECLNEDYVPLSRNFTVDNVKHLMIELNDNKGQFYVPIQDYFTEEITLDITIEELKNKVLDLAINKSIL